MRVKPGRPDLQDYAERFDVPVAAPDAPLALTWLGVSTILLDDGTSALMTDGYFSRPSLARIALRRVAPSLARVDGCLFRARINRLEAVIPVHTHIDHAMDSAVVAERTGARLVGGSSAAQVGRGGGLPEDRVVVATPGEPLTLGAYDVTLVESHHCPPDRFPGAIIEPVVPPVKASAYKCGETWSTIVHHRPSDRRLLIQGSAGFVAGALAGQRADVAYLGVGQLGLQPEAYLVDYWTETVRAVGARRVVLIHWDDFFHPLSEPLRALPYAGDDLDVTMRVFGALADADDIPLHFPTVWRREDPWV
jgi:L-ascorbate metabolism protein UlaG (beta-lactamase superfamily)